MPRSSAAGHQAFLRPRPAPGCLRRAPVVYVDNDPGVVAQARALLAGLATAIAVPGDLRDPAGIRADPEVAELLDWSQPVGLLLCGIVHYILDSEDPAGLVAALADGLPSGSYVFIHHLLAATDPSAAGLQAAMQRGPGRVQFRTLDQVQDLFDGLELVEPGVVPVSQWHPDPDTLSAQEWPVLQLACAGLARKP